MSVAAVAVYTERIRASLAGLVGGFFAGCLMMAAAVVYLWKRNDLLKGIPLVAKMEIEEEVLKSGFTLTLPGPPPKP